MANNKKNNNANANNVRKRYKEMKANSKISYLYDAVFKLENRDGIHKMVMSNLDLRKRVLIRTYTYYVSKMLPDAAINVLKVDDGAMKAILNKHYQDKYDLKFLAKKPVLNTYERIINNTNKVKRIIEEAKKQSKPKAYYLPLELLP